MHVLKNFKNVNTFAKILDGNIVSRSIKDNLVIEVSKIKTKYNRIPGLAIVQVGDRQDSNVYIRMKLKSAEEVGINAKLVKFSKNTTQNELLQKINELNDDPQYDGIILQLPVESDHTIDTDYIIAQINIDKDVDGLHPFNNGQLSHGVIKDVFLPCTPNGCITLIKSTGYEIEGKRAVVVGRSRIVGGPMAQLLVWNNATVTICHSKTQNLPHIISEADILVAAIGKAQFIQGDWIKPGAMVIDCGINSIPDSLKKSGYRLVGDCDFDSCAEKAGWITPVPGGVGPMTVTMLLKNTFEGAVRHVQRLYEADSGKRTHQKFMLKEELFSTEDHKSVKQKDDYKLENGGDAEIQPTF